MDLEMSPGAKSVRQVSLVPQEVIQMEEELFGEANEVYQLLNEGGNRQVDGMRYEQIQMDPEMRGRLDQIRGNIPAYQYMTTRQKAHYLRKLGDGYKSAVECVDSDASTVTVPRRRVRFHQESGFKCKHKLK